MQWSEDKGVSRFLESSGYSGAAPFTGKEPGSNGLTFDLQGRLTICQHGDRRVSRREADGTMVPAGDQLPGQAPQQSERPGVRQPGRVVFHRSAVWLARHVQGSRPRNCHSRGSTGSPLTAKSHCSRKILKHRTAWHSHRTTRPCTSPTRRRRLAIWKAYPVTPMEAWARAACSPIRPSCTRKAMAYPMG